jgi:hypothetical protein
MTQENIENLKEELARVRKEYQVVQEQLEITIQQGNIVFRDFQNTENEYELILNQLETAKEHYETSFQECSNLLDISKNTQTEADNSKIQLESERKKLEVEKNEALLAIRRAEEWKSKGHTGCSECQADLDRGVAAQQKLGEIDCQIAKLIERDQMISDQVFQFVSTASNSIEKCDAAFQNLQDLCNKELEARCRVEEIKIKLDTIEDNEREQRTKVKSLQHQLKNTLKQLQESIETTNKLDPEESQSKSFLRQIIDIVMMFTPLNETNEAIQHDEGSFDIAWKLVKDAKFAVISQGESGLIKGVVKLKGEVKKVGNAVSKGDEKDLESSIQIDKVVAETIKDSSKTSEEATESVLEKSEPTFPLEGEAGNYKDLTNNSVKLNEIEANHFVFDHHEQTRGIKQDDCISLFLTKKHHSVFRRTFQKEEHKMNPRDALAKSIIKTKKVFQEESAYTSFIRKGLLNFIEENKEKISSSIPKN